MEDIEIIGLICDGDESGLAEMIDKYESNLKSYAFSFLRDEFEAEECVFDSFYIAWVKIPVVMPKHLKAYLRAIVKNLAREKLDWKNAGKRKCTGMIIHEMEELPSTFDLVNQVELKIMLDAILKKYYENLKPEKQELFTRRFIMQQPYKEISRELNVNEGNIKMSIIRIKRELEIILQKEGIYIKR